MKLRDFLSAELDREVERSRRALAEVPDGKYDWKPHERSMILGYLTQMVATIPSWIAMQVTRDELDVAPESGSSMKREPLSSAPALCEALSSSAAEAAAALKGTNDDHLQTLWHLKAHGQIVQAAPRFEMIQDTLNHWAHHRGQLTVYLRLLGAKVPSIYGPSADDRNFR